MPKDFLLGIDLEDVSRELAGENAYTHRVPEMTARILEFLTAQQARTTFFVTGDIARKFPALIRRIVADGHEIACHSDLHRPLSAMSYSEFEKDLANNIDVLKQAGAESIRGYRAPFYSLTSDTQWVYASLKAAGIAYSSSVLPAKNPLYGWQEFGEKPRQLHGVLEIPVTVLPYSFLKIPFAGGVYFKVFPSFVLRRLFRHPNFHEMPLVGYLHPQDVDFESQNLTYQAYGFFYNFLLNFNKASVLRKMDDLVKSGFRIRSYWSFAESFLPVSESGWMAEV